MWGPEAMEFQPERWLESSNEKIETPLGVYGNLCVLLSRLGEDKSGLTCSQYKAYFLRRGKELHRLEVRVSHRPDASNGCCEHSYSIHEKKQKVSGRFRRS